MDRIRNECFLEASDPPYISDGMLSPPPPPAPPLAAGAAGAGGGAAAAVLLAPAAGGAGAGASAGAGAAGAGEHVTLTVLVVFGAAVVVNAQQVASQQVSVPLLHLKSNLNMLTTVNFLKSIQLSCAKAHQTAMLTHKLFQQSLRRPLRIRIEIFRA